MFSSNTNLEAIARAMGLTGAALKESWTERVNPINAISTNGWPPFRDDALFPAKFGG